MLLGAGKCTCQNACLDNHCLTALGFSPLSSFSFFNSFLSFPKMIRLVVYFIHF